MPLPPFLRPVAAALLATAWAHAAPVENWFAFRPTNDNGPSVIGVEGWLDAPAGRHGPIIMAEDRLVFASTRRPVKLWGVNLGGGDCVPSHAQAEYWAARFARYGINAVRLHKPWDELYTADDSTTLRPDAIERLDYFCDQLRRHGIYYSWSFFYHHKLGAADLKRLRFPGDLTNPKGKKGNIYGATEYIPEVQDILIEATVNLLNHVNPYTGLRYAEDPALAGVEFQNEASIMFWSEAGLRSMPNYERDLARRFSLWLREKYGSHEGLVQAWGPGALNVYTVPDEHLDRENLLVVSRPEDFATDTFAKLRQQGLFARVSDTAAFLHEVQNVFYSRFAKRVRATGYAGPLIGSCWRGKGDISEYYNLQSDAQVGMIDRHNYFGGLPGWKPQPGKFGAKAQINNPGGGLLSSGMVQVANRPYAFSEWATVFPNEYVAESPSLIAMYGLGLQGWDASYQFAANTAGRGYGTTLQERNLLWAIERPENIGLYPAIARMIHRGDVEQGPVISTRRVSLQDLQQGRLPWGTEGYTGWKDVKTYVGPMPGAALAVGRLVVDFTARPAASELPELEPYERNGVIRSATGQLVWDVSRPNRGFVTLHAPGTRALVGFQADGPQQLGGIRLHFSGAPFAAVYVTSLERNATVETTRRLLVTAVARARNTGMVFGANGDELLDVGRSPILVEPVTVELAVTGRRILSFQPLDHDGRIPPGQSPSSAAGDRVVLEGTRYKTIYYELTLE